MAIRLEGVTGRPSSDPSARELGPINMRLYPGLTGLIGANGAGKSVLMELLAQVWKPNKGEIVYEINGIQLHGFEARRLTGYVPQQISIYEDLTVRDYLQYIAGLKCLDDRAAVRAVIGQMSDWLDIRPVLHEKLGQLSVGQQRLAMIAQAFLGAPAFLFLDEPFVSLDIRMRRGLLDMLAEAAQRSVVLVSSHITEEMKEEYDRVITLADGKLEAITADYEW